MKRNRSERRSGVSQESVRKSAVSRVLAGESPEKVSRELGFHRSRIYAWLKSYKEQGEAGLEFRPRGGRPPKFGTKAQQQLLHILIDKSPRDLGLHTDLWSCEALALLLRERFSVTLGTKAFKRLLIHLGLGDRQLQRRLSQWQSPKVNYWLSQDYAILQRRAEKADAIILLVTTVFNSHAGSYALLANSPKGDLYFGMFSHYPTDQQVSSFLKRLLQAIKKKVYLLAGNDCFFDDSLHYNKTRQLLNNHPEDIDLIYLLVDPYESYVGRKEPGYGLETPNPPPHSNMEAWALLLSKSLLEFQYPLSSFLGALTRSLNGWSIIASNLQAPASFIRPPTLAGTSLQDMILHNRGTEEIWYDNPFVDALIEPGDMYTMDEIFPRSEWKNNHYCKALLMTGIQHILGFCFSGPDRTLCGLIIARLSDQPFSAEEKQFLHRLRPHLENAMVLTINHWRHAFTVKALEEATDKLEIATLILDGNRKVIQSSGTAKELLEQKKYFALKDQRLDFLHPKKQAQFEQAVEKAIDWRKAPLGNKPIEAMRFTYTGEDWLGVLVQPISPPSMVIPHSVAVSPHVVVYISNPTLLHPHPRQQLIMRLFNLSNREAHLTNLLTDGHALEEAAKMMGVTAKTARTYLQHIYEKVGVKRQQDLIQRVLKSVALLV